MKKQKLFTGWRIAYLVMMTLVVILTFVQGNYLAGVWQIMFVLAWLVWQNDQIDHMESLRQQIEFLDELRSMSQEKEEVVTSEQAQ